MRGAEAFSLYVFKTLYIIFDKKTLRKNDNRSRTYFIVTHCVKSAKCFLISDFTNTENLARTICGSSFLFFLTGIAIRAGDVKIFRCCIKGRLNFGPDSIWKARVPKLDSILTVKVIFNCLEFRSLSNEVEVGLNVK